MIPSMWLPAAHGSYLVVSYQLADKILKAGYEVRLVKTRKKVKK